MAAIRLPHGLACGGCGLTLFRASNRGALARQPHAFVSRCGGFITRAELETWNDGELTALAMIAGRRCRRSPLPPETPPPGVASRVRKDVAS